MVPAGADALSQRISPTLRSMGYDLVDLEFAGGGLLRVSIDVADGSRPVQVADCERVSDQLGRMFAVDAVDYQRLEVSSPGLDRPLRRPQDFQRFSGARITLQLRDPVEGRRKFTGRLLPAGAAVAAGRSGAPDAAVAAGAGPRMAATDAPRPASGDEAGVAVGADVADVPRRWTLWYSDAPEPAAPKGGARGLSGRLAPQARAARRPGRGGAPAEVDVPGADGVRHVEFTLDQVERARLVPNLEF